MRLRSIAVTELRARFLEGVEALVQHPRVEVVVAHVGGPTDSALLDEVARVWSVPASDEVLSLYREVSRLELVWRALPAGTPDNHARPPADKTISGSERDAFGAAEGDGVIELAPARDVFLEESSLPVDLEPVLLDGVEVGGDKLRVFDNHTVYRQLLVARLGAGFRFAIANDYLADVEERTLELGRALAFMIGNLGYAGTEVTPAVLGELGLVSPDRRWASLVAER
ncbi:MAG: hypothetical protein U0271_08855 [Polyangiaceae bacterium]